MRADYSINCESAEYSKYRLFAAATIVVYPIGTLLLYWFVLARNRQLLYPPEVHQRPKEDIAIAMEAKRGNELTLRSLEVLHDACEGDNASLFYLGIGPVQPVGYPAGDALVFLVRI